MGRDMMRKIKVGVNTKYVGSKVTKIIEVEDEATDDEIEELVNETLWGMIETYWEEIE